jgi:hypothetical protein
VEALKILTFKMIDLKEKFGFSQPFESPSPIRSIKQLSIPNGSKEFVAAIDDYFTQLTDT